MLNGYLHIFHGDPQVTLNAFLSSTESHGFKGNPQL